MTMLDRMRRHRNWLKWSLALVCLAFVIFYIPDLMRSSTDAAAGDTVAVIEGQEIRGEEFRRTYQAQLQSYRAAYGGRMSESLLKQLGPKAAFEMISLGATFTADDVMRLGLANRAVAPEAVLPTAIEIAKAWCESDPVQLAATKNMFYRMLELSFEEGLALGKDVSAAMRARTAAAK